MQRQTFHESPQPQSALSGVRVLDLSQVAAGPYCATLLADMGAEVIKVEPPEGDMMRYVDRVFPGANSSYFVGVNRNKSSMVIDLRLASGRQLLHRMVRDCDVLIQNNRPRVAERMEIDYATLSALNPRLVYVSITGFGEEGPDAGRPGMDPILQAMGGMMHVTGEAGGGPMKVGIPIADFSTSYLACYGVMLALFHRERTGRGQKVSLSLLDCVVASMANLATGFFATGDEPVRWGNAHPQLVPYQTFETADDVLMVACLNDRFWRRLCAVVEHPEWIEDERFRGNPDRVANREALIGMLKPIFAQRPAAVWLHDLQAAEVPCTLVNNFQQVFSEPQVLRNGMVVDLEHRAGGPIKVLGNPVKLSETPARLATAAPILGADSGEIAARFGLDAAEITELRALGVFGAPGQ